MIKYSVGDKIKLLDDDTRGVITKIEEGTVVIENEFGFEERYSFREILPDLEMGEEFPEVKEEKPKPVTKKAKKKQKKAEFKETVEKNVIRNLPEYREKLEERYQKEIKVSRKRKGTFVLDLHYGQLENYNKQLPVQFILQRQLKAAIHGIEKAANEGFEKIILVHGKGKGVLEEEVKKYLDSAGYTHYDADFRQYKLGATEVEL